METKICGKCKREKPITEFYPHIRDGYQSHCKECKRAESRERNKQPERKEYNKKFYQQLKKDGYFEEYQQKPEVKERKAEQQREYSRNPNLRIKYLARWYTKRMVRNGTITKEPCAICGKEQSEAHHPDYTEPLLIVWLCSDCHRNIHRAKAEGK